MLNYAQKSSRAGQDRGKSKAIIIRQETKRQETGGVVEEEQRIVKQYIEGKEGVARCRRIVLDKYLDRQTD